MNFHVDANPGELKEKVETAISQLKEMAAEMIGPAAGVLDLFKIHVGNNDKEIVIVIESDFILFKLVAEELDRVANIVSPNIHAELSFLARVNVLSKILGNVAEGLDSSLTFDFKIDSTFLHRFKDCVFKGDITHEQLDTILVYLF